MMVFILFLICAAAYDPLVKHAIKWFQALYFLSSFFGALLASIQERQEQPVLSALLNSLSSTALLEAVPAQGGHREGLCALIGMQFVRMFTSAKGLLSPIDVVTWLGAGQFGPNATTWLLPGEVFPTDIRATCHGISAATGKVGALVAG